jgi:transcriptional regulator with XRE-family HTH domain
MLDIAVKHAVWRKEYHAPMETMGQRIKALREARGMSQQELADAVGVSKSAVSQWELGQSQNVKLKTFLALLESLRTDMEYLVYGAARKPQGDGDRTRKPRTGNG